MAEVYSRKEQKSIIFSRDDDADDDECSHQILSSFVVFLFSML